MPHLRSIPITIALWLVVLVALPLGTYFSGCVDEIGYDAGLAAGCKEGDLCHWGRCIVVPWTSYTCVSECNAANEVCEPGNGEPGASHSCRKTSWGLYCLMDGIGKDDDLCWADFDCSSGLQCLNVEGYYDSPRCHKVCNDQMPCITGTCTDSGLGYSVCMQF